MKFIFHQDFCDTMRDMEEETPEREITINPKTCSAPEFKNFAFSYMFSTRSHLNLLNDINSKLDQVIESNRLVEGRVTTLEDDVATIKSDMTRDLEFKDGEIADLRGKVTEGKKRMDQLDIQIADLVATHTRDTEALRGLCGKLTADTLTLERYTRSYNFRLFNMKEANDEKTTDVIDKVNDLISRVTGSDIKVEYGHRTGPKMNDGKDRAIICRIASRLERAAVRSKRDKFFAAGFPIYDDLPAPDLVEKKKYSAVMKQKWEAGQRKQLFTRGKWYLNGVVFKG